jgi:transcriptional regulator with XRE-family HTH domain
MTTLKRSRTPLTPEQIEDAKRLKAAFERVKGERRKRGESITQDAMAAACGWSSQSAAWQYLHGHIPLNIDALTKISAYLEVPAVEISPHLARQIEASVPPTLSARGQLTGSTPPALENAYPAGDQVSVALFNARGSMGEGIPVPESEIVLGNIDLSAEWIRNTLPKITSPRNLRFIEGKGPSMEPTFADGDILLVDTGVAAVTIDAIYVLSGHGRLFVKRVRQKLDGAFEISSDNPVVKTSDTLNGDHEIAVHGRVVWAWNGKRL